MRDAAAVTAPLPRGGEARYEVFVDSRDPSRALRVSWHPDTGTVVLSIWRRERCVATHHLPAGDIGRLLDLLARA